MSNILKNNDKKLCNYINSTSQFALLEFKQYFFNILNKYTYKNIVFLCIGTDRATGDSLGPLVGYKLSKLPFKNNIFIYGTLDKPVHAKNLIDTIKHIDKNHKNDILITIDASLGQKEYINYISLGEGGLKPGAGFNKNLPLIGDIYIKGIVNEIGRVNLSILQNTRLSVVMKMADVISYGLWHCISCI